MMKQTQFSTQCDRLMVFSFCALIYFFPISIALVESFSGLAIACFLVKRGVVFFSQIKEKMRENRTIVLGDRCVLFFQSFKPRFTPLNWAIAFFIGINFFSLLFSQYHLLSLRGFFFKLLQAVFIYFSFIECMTTRKRIHIFFFIFFVSAALISVNGFFQKIYGHDFIHGYPLMEGRVRSSLKHPNDFGGYLVLVTPLFFCSALLMNVIKKEAALRMKFVQFVARTFVFCFFLLSFACLIFTYSRGVWLAFIVAFFLLSFLKRRLIWIHLVLISILCVCVFFYPHLIGIRDIYNGYSSVEAQNIENNTTAQNSDQEYVNDVEQPFWSVKNMYFRFKKIVEILEYRSGRIGYWKEALIIFKDYPILGSGLNTYSVITSRYTMNWGGYPHNSYLQMLAELGFFGLLFFLAILFILFQRSFAALRKITDPIFHSYLLGSLIGLSGFLVHSFFDTNFYSVQLVNLMWLVFAVIMAVQMVGLPNNTEMKGTLTNEHSEI